MKSKQIRTAILTGLGIGALAACVARGSSHREAPLITQTPKLDAADFYMFNSYETGRSNFVTIVANYLPLQDAYGGPNYFTLDPNGLYEIHIDNNGDGVEDLTFQFQFTNSTKNLSLVVGPAGNTRTNPVPVINIGQLSAGNTAALNVVENYSVKIIRGKRRTGTAANLSNVNGGGTVFTKPTDNIGNKSIPDYAAYANSFMYNVNIPGSPTPARMFVGQRKDPFVVNLGETFDLVNIKNPLGPVDAAKDSLRYKNVTSIILEVPKALLTSGTNTVIAAWTTASKIDGTNITQVSRLGQPLVNEVVIGLRDKDKFNASEPKDDGQFADYVTHPTLPAILELLFGSAGVKAPTLFPRTDLVAVFLTGVAGVNQTTAVGEMVRLNTATPTLAAAQQNNLGVIGGDVAGFPNGRRPGDDVVDIALRVVMGKLLSATDAPSGQLPFTDGALVNASMFKESFPYLNEPIPGSPNDPYLTITVQASAQANGAYQNVDATYDAANQQIVAPKSNGNAAFYRLNADGKATLSQPVVDQTSVRFGVK